MIYFYINENYLNKFYFLFIGLWNVLYCEQKKNGNTKAN